MLPVAVEMGHGLYFLDVILAYKKVYLDPEIDNLLQLNDINALQGTSSCLSQSVENAPH